MKKISFFLIALVCSLTTMAATEFKARLLNYRVLSDNTVAVIQSEVSGGAIVPPTVTYGGKTYTVTALYDAFEGCDKLTSVKLPSTLTSIGAGAFEDCSTLTSITIPASVTSIGAEAFVGCSALTSITIPASVTAIGEFAFCGCSALTSMAIPASVDTIGYAIFAGCENLSSVVVDANNAKYDSRDSCNAIIETTTNTLIAASPVTTIPSTVKTIGSGAMAILPYDTIHIPEGVVSIGEYAFQKCRSLVSITFPESIESIGDGAFDKTPWFGSLPDGEVYVGKVLYAYKGEAPDGFSCIVEEGTKAIGAYAFDGSNIGDIYIPSSVTSIGEGAFYNCKHLQVLELPKGITTIGDGAFIGCEALTSVVLPESLSSCGSDIFDGCSSLTSAQLPSTWTTIPAGIFEGCSSLTSVTIPAGVTSIDAYAFSGCTSLAAITIPDKVEYIGDNAFAFCHSLQTIALPHSVKQIADGAFYNCSNLKSLTILTGVKEVGERAFASCVALCKVEIPNTVTTIGQDAFQNCDALASVELPNSITSLGSRVFYDCEALTSIVLPSSITTIPDSAFYRCNALAEVTIPEGVTHLGENSFQNCTALKSVVLPSTLETIDTYAFYNCYNLVAITIPENVRRIGHDVFTYCSRLKEVKWNANNYRGRMPFDNIRTQITTFIFGDAVETIPAYCCSGMSQLRNIVIPNGVKTISYAAFHRCSALESITIPKSLTTMDEYVFDGCSKLTSVMWNAENCTTFKWNAFDDVRSQITTFAFGKTVAIIPDNCCRGMNNLKEVNIPSDVHTIGQYAFYDCSALESITLPSTLKKVYCGAFSRCGNLKKTNYMGDIASWCGIEFSCYDSNPIYYSENFYVNNTLITDLEIPYGVSSIGDYAFYYNISLKSIEIPSTVTSIGSDAFYYCSSSLNHIWVNANNPVYDDRGGCYALIETSTNKLILGCRNSSIPNTVTVIGRNAFRDCDKLTSITIPNNVKTIEYRAFYDCDGLSSITLPYSVREIAEDAFCSCSYLSNLYDCSGVVSVGDDAFSGTPWYNNKSNGAVYINNVLYKYKGSYSGSYSVWSGATSLSPSAFYDQDNLTAITIPGTVKSIGNYAFSSCDKLSSVTIKEGVKTIGCAFRYCPALQTITLPASITEVAYWTFEHSTNLSKIYCKMITPPSKFYIPTETKDIYVPHIAVNDYKAAWSEYADKIKGYSF